MNQHENKKASNLIVKIFYNVCKIFRDEFKSLQAFMTLFKGL